MDDRTMLELAAKAAGIETQGWRAHEFQPGYYVLPETETGAYCVWNPLTDDGDALRLAVKLHLALLFPMRGDSFPQVGAGQVGSMTCAKMEPHDPDPYAATRRAIVRAAAEIGRGMP